MSRRGRPPGSTDPAAQAKRLSLEQFAALRAYLDGMPAVQACRRYLSSAAPPSGEAAALRLLGPLLATVIDTARLRPGDAAEAITARRNADLLQQCLDHLSARRRRLLALAALAQVRRRPADPAPATPPESSRAAAAPAALSQLPAHLRSLEDFQTYYINTRLDGEDPDLSVAEWQEMLQDSLSDWEGEAGMTVPDPQTTGQQLSALAHAELADLALASGPGVPAITALPALEACRWVVDRHPRASDGVVTWFTGSTAKRLQAAGLGTLQAIADLMNLRGDRWWTQVPGLGPRRAERVLDWLQIAGGAVELRLPAALSQRAATRAAPRPLTGGALAGLGLEPLEWMLAGHALDGNSGSFRLPPHLRPAAREDAQALERALAHYAERRRTLAVYSREVLRLLLWCYLVKGQALCSMTVEAAEEFKAFLDAIPGHWIHPIPVPRGHPHWRPYRGQLDTASTRKALTAASAVFQQLVATGYVSANPLGSLRKSGGGQRPTVNVKRAFGEAQWQFILQQLDTLPAEAYSRAAPSTPPAYDTMRAAASARRTRALVLLLHASGMRREECFRARLSDLTPATGAEGAGWQLRVPGSAHRSRSIPLPPSVHSAVLHHLQDRATLYRDDFTSDAGRARIPLISVLQPPPRAASGDPTSHGDPLGALGPDGMHQVLKRFLARCAMRAGDANLDPEQFRRASLHSLRHTFGHTLAKQHCDVRQVQLALGHARAHTARPYTLREGPAEVPAPPAATEE